MGPVRLAFVTTVAAKEPVPLPVTPPVKVMVWSPVFAPEIETAPAPMVSAEVLAALPVSVTVPVFTVRAVVSVAFVTAPAVRPAAVPVRFVATPLAGVPKAGVTKVGDVVNATLPEPLVPLTVVPAILATVVASAPEVVMSPLKSPLVMVELLANFVRFPVAGDPLVLTLPPPEGVAHAPSPRQKVELDAEVPELRFVTGRLPVTPVVKGSPVQFVSVPDVGVPSKGVTSVGLVSTTNFVPVPVCDAIDVAFPEDVIGPVRFALVTTVAAKEPVPEPVTPPVNDIVWSPVFVPDTVALEGTVSVLEVVPPAIVKPMACAANVRPFTVDGVMAPREMVMFGFTVGLVMEKLTPFAFVPATLVTVPAPPETASILIVLPDGVIVMVLPVDVSESAPVSPLREDTPPPLPPPFATALRTDICYPSNTPRSCASLAIIFS